MGIMCFLPGYAGDDEQELTCRGLGDLLDPAVRPIFTPIDDGPGGQAGALVHFAPFPPTPYDDATQKWQAAPPCGELAKGRYWLGFTNAQKPTPEMLQRRDLIEGEPVVLSDDKVWIIPCCEYAPKRHTLDRDSGAEIQVVKDNHREWVEISNELFQVIIAQGYGTVSDESYTIEIPDAIRYAALTLAKNYRVNADVVDLLELVDDHTISELVLAATGITHLAKLIRQKKSTESFCPQLLPT